MHMNSCKHMFLYATFTHTHGLAHKRTFTHKHTEATQVHMDV